MLRNITTNHSPRVCSELSSPGILRLILNSPATLNSVDADMLNELAAVIETAGTDPTVRVVLLTGIGRAFCAGADLTAFDRSAASTVDTAIIDAANRLTSAITAIPKPVVCALNGLAAGVGVSLALSCDVVVAHESAYFLLAFTKIGLMPDGGATALVAASLGRHRAMKLALLAERFDAAEAATAGLVSRVVASDEFDSAVEQLVHQLATGPTAALGQTKTAINLASIHRLDEALTLERSSQCELLASADFAEGASAFQAKRPPVFLGD
ncbi:enoyl-CoA hydratase [Mycobacteroides abscessus]|uniref:enoyl-CoA hydratase n=1 Tax=Mycobacteroides abscessus TaxID=36809 RepID=UPI000D87E19A|nr:enoyl-CoA hydratase [Mycobacteroides abscessus]SPX87960.1 enoyl-COA hydratase Echa11 [Mycobacteroides abscessus]